MPNTASARGSSPLVGMLLADWLKVLRQSGGIAPRCWKRAIHITLQSLLNEALSVEERKRFGEQIERQKPMAPLFVLGLPRSGTTLLHQALCLDPRFAYPTRAQVYCPHTFLVLEGRTRSLWGRVWVRLNFLWSRLVYGNLSRANQGRGVGFALPAEDEFALAMSGLSSHLTYLFPKRREFERFRVWDDMSPQEQGQWESLWISFLKKLTLRYPGRRLILKSHQHTARIPVLLRHFPDSRFIFISRDPESILRSRISLRSRAIAYWGLQDWAPNPTEELEEGRRTFLAYLRDRELIPPGQLHELRYERIYGAPFEALQEVYRALSLPNFEEVQELARQELERIQDHQTRVHPELPPELTRRLREEWALYFDAFGY